MTQHTDHTPPTNQQLDEITARAAHLFEYVTLPTEADQLAGVDVPLLLADLRRARDRVAELEAYAYGCDAEGCVLPHSSWCDAAKKTATANEGCTCGKPWTGHPQPHAMHCWTVNPPRVEVEEMRKRIAELTAENAKLIRWHHEDGTEMDKQRATIARLHARVTELEGSAVEARAALAALCYDLEDPGTAALGALYLISQATVGVDAPKDDAALALARRDATVMRRCAEFVRDTYSGEWADDAAATLERDADITERGCPGFEREYQGESDAKRRLANCKHCGKPRTGHAPAAVSAAGGAR